MAKQPKFSADRLASELMASGNAASSKVDFMLSRLANLSSTFVRPSDQAASYVLANIAEGLARMGFQRNRIAYAPTAPDGVERLVIKYPNFSIRLSLRLIGTARELSCTYLTGSIKLPQLTSARIALEFLKELDGVVNTWLVEWEQVLFQAWQTARLMERAANGIEPYLVSKLEETGFKYNLTMLSNYAEISINVARGVKLTAKVPHEKFERAIDTLISEATIIDKAVRQMSDDINISA